VLIGSCLLLGMLAFLGSALGPLPVWPAGLLVWLGGVLGFPRADSATRRLSLVLLAAGLIALTVAAGRGAEIDPVADLTRMTTINLPIVGLFLGVAFLSLVGTPSKDVPDARTKAVGAASAANSSQLESASQRSDSRPRADHEPLPQEADRSSAANSRSDHEPLRQGGLWSTLAAIHLVGAVINLSMTAMSGDRMARGGGLGRREAIVLARGHCAAAFWSPFFVAAAVAHTYAPQADASITVPLGIIGALLALLLTGLDARRALTAAERATPFVGIVPDRHALVLTGALLAAALGLKMVLADVPMVVVVTAVTPPLALLLMPARARPGAFGRLLGSTLPATIGQVVLFLAAGVFAFGISRLLADSAEWFSMLQGGLGLWVYPASTALIVGAGYLGAHPVITIAALSSVLLPLGADQSLLAFAFLSGWAVGTAVAPLSGMNLFLMGRYGVRARDIVRWGPSYALQMLAVVTVLMLLAAFVLDL
jgi:hypothetical protein